jgi:hypothetical protein
MAVHPVVVGTMAVVVVALEEEKVGSQDWSQDNIQASAEDQSSQALVDTVAWMAIAWVIALGMMGTNQAFPSFLALGTMGSHQAFHQ